MTMTATHTADAARRLLRRAPLLGVALAAAAVLLLAVGPLGWRAGWWHFRFAFTTLMPYAAYCGVAAAAVSALALAFGWRATERRGVAIGVLAFAVGAAIAYVPWHYDQMRGAVPSIHDITTDWANPPTFDAVIPLRQAEQGNTTAYPGDSVAEQQRRAYPDIAPVILDLPPAQAFARALEGMQRLGWTIVAADEAAGHIEASERSRWFGFTDDIVVRVAPSPAGAGPASRIDIRSCSRQGRGDFGVNAARVRRFIAVLRAG